MEVILQKYNDRGMLTSKTSQVKPRKEVFEQALLGMKVSQEIVDAVTIFIEFRFMISDGAMGVLGDNNFRIYLRSQQTWRPTINEVVAHELKHIAIELRRPKKLRIDSKKKGPYKWEELDCTRAEKKWGKLDYFECLIMGENK